MGVLAASGGRVEEGLLGIVVFAGFDEAGWEGRGARGGAGGEDGLVVGWRHLESFLHFVIKNYC